MTWDRQTDLWLQFGAPHLHVREPRPGTGGSARVRAMFRYRFVRPRGRWAFAVVAGHWQLSLLDLSPVSGATRSDTLRRRALARLDGQRLTRAMVAPDTGRTTLEFDLGAVLEVRRVAPDEPDAIWLLYKPRGYVLAVRGNGEYDHRRGTSHAPPRWRPIARARRLTTK